MVDTEVVLGVLRSRFNEDRVYAAPSLAQLGLMNGLISEGLADPGNRISVLREITGLKAITSSKQLTRLTVHEIIDFLYDKERKELSDEGRNFIGEIEASL